MIDQRRVIRMESAMTPLDSVLALMAEAHQFPTLDDFARSKAGAADIRGPLDRIVDRALAQRPKPRHARRASAQASEAVLISDCAFLYYLWVQVEEAADDFVQRAILIALLSQERLNRLIEDGNAGTFSAEHLAIRRASVIDPTQALMTSVRVEAEARDAISGWYFEHKLRLCPATDAAWHELLARVDCFAWLIPMAGGRALEVAPSDEAPAVAESDRPDDNDPMQHRAAQLVSAARLASFEYLGRADDARALVRDLLRSP